MAFLSRLLRKSVLHQLDQRLPGCLRSQLEWRRVRSFLRSQQTPRRRIGRAHEALAIHDQHAFGKRGNHEFIDLYLHAGSRLTFLGQLFFPRQPHCQLVGKQGYQKKAGTAQRCLQKTRVDIAAALHGTPRGIGQQNNSDAGCRAKSQQNRAEHRSQQHRQRKQRRVVKRACLKEIEQPERHHIHANGQHPQAVKRAGRRAGMRPEPHGQRCAKIGNTDHQRPVVQRRAQGLERLLQDDQHGRDGDAGIHEYPPQAPE